MRLTFHGAAGDVNGSCHLVEANGRSILVDCGMFQGGRDRGDKGGRVRHHLRHNLGHAACSVIFVGFSATGTLARIIIDGAQTVKLFGDRVPVRAQVHAINGFSADAGRSGLIEWHCRTGRPEITFPVHVEDGARASLADGLAKTRIEQPVLHQRYEGDDRWNPSIAPIWDTSCSPC